MKMARILTAIIVGTVILSLTPPVGAGDNPALGKFMMVARPADGDSIKLPDGGTRHVTIQEGFAWSENHDNPFGLMSTQCWVVIVNSPKGEVTFEMLMCESIDPDGDMLFSMAVADAPKPAVMDIVGGTGKYEGATGVIQTHGPAERTWPDGSAEFSSTITEFKFADEE